MYHDPIGFVWILKAALFWLHDPAVILSQVAIPGAEAFVTERTKYFQRASGASCDHHCVGEAVGVSQNTRTAEL